MLEKRFSERGVANSALFSRKMFSEYIRSYSGDRAPISTFLESVMFVISFQDLRRRLELYRRFSEANDKFSFKRSIKFVRRARDFQIKRARRQHLEYAVALTENRPF